MNRRGFTLIELLVAITVLVIVIGIVFVCFVSVTDTAAIARESTQRMHLEQYLWRQLTTNLGAAYSDASCQEGSYAFKAENGDGAYGPADKLTLAVAIPLDGPKSLPGVFKQVSYEVMAPSFEGPLIADASVSSDADDNQTKQVLRITEQPLVLGEFSAIEESSEHTEMEELDDMKQIAQVRQVPIASFDVTFYDGEEWQESWDSIETGLLPWAVRVRANFPRTEEEASTEAAAGIDVSKESDLDLIIALPTGAGVQSPWTDLNHARHTDNQVQVDANGQPIQPGTGTDGSGTGTNTGGGTGSGTGSTGTGGGRGGASGGGFGGSGFGGNTFGSRNQ